MSAWLMGVVTLIYFYCCADLAVQKNYPMSLAYFGWAVANVGVIWALRRMSNAT
jgi:hypothetical protein